MQHPPSFRSARAAPYGLAALCIAITAPSAHAAERSIAVPPVLQSSWEFPTHVTGGRLRPHLGVGFWQRGSGAKPGVGSNYVSVLEYQLPETAPPRVRSATLQFSGKAAQCVGAEPVVIEVHAYAGNGRAEEDDTRAGSRVARLSADCGDARAFAQPIDVTAIVRQLSVPSGVRHVGFNIRKANNRQGPGLFNLSAGKLTVVLADPERRPEAAQRHGPPPPMAPVAGPGLRGERPPPPRLPPPSAQQPAQQPAQHPAQQRP